MGTHKRDCRGRFMCIRNGVNAHLYEDINPIVSNYDRKDAIVTGRINAFKKWKYSDRWIKWCSKVKLPKKMIHEYVGTGSFLSSAKSCFLKTKNKNNEIIFRNEVIDFKKKVSIIKSWDLFLYEINQQEGLSVSVLEALACGVPVICSDHYGNKEIIKNGVNGFVFTDRDHARKILTDLCDKPKLLANLKRTTEESFKKDKLDAKYMAEGYVNIAEKFFKR